MFGKTGWREPGDGAQTLLCLHNLLKIYFVSVLPLCTFVYPVQAWYPPKSEGGSGSPGATVTSRCEPPYGFWELNSQSLQEQHVLHVAESSLRPPAPPSL